MEAMNQKKYLLKITDIDWLKSVWYGAYEAYISYQVLIKQKFGVDFLLRAIISDKFNISSNMSLHPGKQGFYGLVTQVSERT